MAILKAASLPINFSVRRQQKELGILKQRLEKMEKCVLVAWENFVKDNKNTPPNIFQVRHEAFKLTGFSSTKNYTIFNAFLALLLKNAHPVFKLDANKVFIVRRLKKEEVVNAS